MPVLMHGHVHVFRMLVSEFQADLDCKDLCGWTPLHHACVNEHLDVVRLLVSRVSTDDMTGRMPMTVKAILHCM